MRLGRQLRFLFAGLLLAACHRTPGPGRLLPALQALRLSPDGGHLGVGQTVQLYALADYQDGSRRDVTPAAFWAAPPDAGVLVEPGGRVQALRPGETSVEAEWGGFAAHALLHVEETPVAPRALSVVPSELALEVGGAAAFSASVTEADGRTGDATGAVRWESSHREVATLSETVPGFLTAVSPGTAFLRARLGDAVSEARVEVRTAAPPSAAFPLHVAGTGRYLVDAQGVPFRMQGEAAWSLIANLSADEVDTYLEDRAHKGFNTVLVNLIERRYAENAPRNRAGVEPFQPAGDLAAPVEAYFDFAASALVKARARGFLVLLAPAYPGYGCPTSPSLENEGWAVEMSRSSPASCLAYGRYVGRRFRSFDNLLWVQGGDCLPAPGSALEACALQVQAGIRDAQGTALQTGHWSPNTTSLDEPAFAASMQLDAVYRYRTPQLGCREAYARTPPLPAFLIESGYENEGIQGSTPPVRKYLYAGSLTCTAGVISGSRPIWLFGEGWEKALDSPGANDVARLGHLLETLPWERLVPSGVGGMRTLVTAGGGTAEGEDEVVAAAAEDGSALLAYVPPGNGRGGRDIVVDVRALSGPAAARWYNPWAGTSLPIGRVPVETPWWFTTPGDNGSGYDDWVLVLTREAGRLPATSAGPASR